MHTLVGTASRCLLCGLFFVIISTFNRDLYGQKAQYSYTLTSSEADVDTFIACALYDQVELIFDAQNFRGGQLFWVNTKQNLIGASYSVADGDYSNPTRRFNGVHETNPSLLANTPVLRRKVRTDFNEYKFKVVMPSVPTDFEKKVVFRHYPAVPVQNIGTFITTELAVDTLEACVTKEGIAEFTLPSGKVSETLDALIHWEIVEGKLSNETLQSVFRGDDGRNTTQSMINIPNFKNHGIVYNEHSYKLRMTLRRSGADNSTYQGHETCIKNNSFKDIILRLYSKPDPPVTVVGDTLWLCEDNPYEAPLQIDDNYHRQFEPFWVFNESASSRGFAGQTPYVEDVSSPGTKLIGITRSFSNAKTFNNYNVLVRLSSPLCASEEVSFVVMVGAPASDANIYEDTVYACNTDRVTGIGFDNVGISASYVGYTNWNQLAGTQGQYSIGVTGTGSQGSLIISNLDISSTEISDYKFELVTQNGQCFVQRRQKDTLVVRVVPNIVKPLVVGGLTESKVRGYVTKKSHKVPILLTSTDNGVHRWRVPSPLTVAGVSSYPNRFFVSSITPPVIGTADNYLLKAYTQYGTCASDTNRIDLEVLYGFPLYMQRIVTLEETISNEVVRLDTMKVCTNGSQLKVAPYVSGEGLVTITKVSNPGNTLSGLTFQTIKDGNNSDTLLQINYDPISERTQHILEIMYSASISGNTIVEKKFTIIFTPSVNRNPIPDDFDEVYLCSQRSYALNADKKFPGVWKVVKSLGLATLVDPNDPNTLVNDLAQQQRHGSVAEYIFEWTVENNICSPVKDTQRVINLPLLTTPYVVSMDRLARGGVVNTTLLERDTICITTGTPGNLFYRINTNILSVGQSRWRFRDNLSENVISTPVMSAFKDQNLEVSLEYSGAPQSTTYAFERIIYHENMPVGCDTNRIVAYITVEQNLASPRYAGDLRYCIGDPEIQLTATDVNNVKWRVIGIRDAQNNDLNPISNFISPTEAKGLQTSFYGFPFVASTSEKDSFSIVMEMSATSDYCQEQPLSTSVELRFVNPPSAAQFVDNNPLILCDRIGGVPVDEGVVRAQLQGISIVPKIGNTHYRKLFEGSSKVNPAVDSQLWEYAVFHGPCDTMRATKPVLIYGGSASTAKVAEDTIFVCYDATGAVQSSFDVVANTIPNTANGTWIVSTLEGEEPTLANATTNVVSVSGAALMNNLNASPKGQVEYRAIWNMHSSCGATQRDTTIVIHYAVPNSMPGVNTTPFYPCVQKPGNTVTIELNHKQGSIGETLWGVQSFSPEITVGRNSQRRTGGAADYFPPLPADGTDLGWTETVGGVMSSSSLLFENPTFVVTSTTTTNAILRSYENFLTNYHLIPKMRNGYRCPIIDMPGAVASRIVVPPPLSDPSFNFPGYDANSPALYAVCYGNSVPGSEPNPANPSPRNLSFKVSVDRTTPHEYVQLTTNALSVATAKYENINGLKIDVDCQNSASNGCSEFDYNVSPYAGAYDFSKDFFISMNTRSFWATGDRSDDCDIQKPLKVRAIENDRNLFTGLGNIQDASYEVCKGGQLKAPIRIENSSANKFVLEKRIYDFNTSTWSAWSRVDSFSNRTTDLQFVVKEITEDSVQFRVEGSLKMLSSSLGCNAVDELGILQDTVSVRTTSPYSYLPSTVGTISINGVAGGSGTACYNVETKEKLSVASYKLQNIGTPPNKTVATISHWERGISNVKGAVEWAEIPRSAFDTLDVNYIKNNQYYRAVIKTEENCLATSPEILMTYKRGAAATGCPNPHPVPALSPTGTKLIKRFQFPSGQKNLRVFGFNNDIPFKWDFSVVGVFSSNTGFPLQGNGVDEVFFDAKETSTVVTDEVIFTRSLDPTDPSDVLRSQDTVEIHIDVVPVPRLNPNGITYSKSVISGNTVYIKELAPNLPYKWVSKEPTTTLKTGIPQKGNAINDYSYTSVLTAVPLQDSILFIKQGQNTSLNNSLDTVTLYITVLPEDRLAFDAGSREFLRVVNSGDKVLLDDFRPKINFDWETATARNGLTTGTSPAGIANTGSGVDMTSYVAVVNTGTGQISEKIFFVTKPADPANYVYGLLDTVVYTVIVNPIKRLHQFSSSLLESVVSVDDSLEILHQINQNVPFQWTSKEDITYKVQTVGSTALSVVPSTGRTGNGATNFRYFGLASRTLPFKDTIQFVKLSAPALAAQNNAQDTLNWVISVARKRRLNSNVGISNIDTVFAYVAVEDQVELRSPYLTQGIPYKWSNSTLTNKIGVPPTGMSSTGDALDFTFTSTLRDLSKRSSDSFLITRTGGDVSLYNYADTIFFIVNVLPKQELVNISHPLNVLNNAPGAGWYESSSIIPYVPNIRLLPYSHLINPEINYSWKRISINGNTITDKPIVPPFFHVNYDPLLTNYQGRGFTNLELGVLVNNTGATVYDTFLIYRDGSAKSLLASDSLVLFLEAASRPTLLRVPNSSNGIVRYEIPYESTSINIGQPLLNSNVFFSFEQVSQVANTVSAVDIASLETDIKRQLINELTIPIQENRSDQKYVDTFLIYNRPATSKTNLDSLTIIITQHPLTRLRKASTAREISYTVGPGASTVTIEQEINQDVTFDYELANTPNGVIATTMGSSVNSLTINTNAILLDSKIIADTLLLLRSQNPGAKGGMVPRNSLDSLYVIVNAIPQRPRLRADGQPPTVQRIISSAGLTGADISMVIDREINSDVPYNISLLGGGGSGVFDSVSFDNGTFSVFTGTGSGTNILRMKSNPNKTGKSIYNTLLLTKVDIPTYLNNSQDTLRVDIEFTPLPCQPILNPAITDPSSVSQLDFNDNQAVNYNNLFSDVGRTWVIKPRTGSTPMTGFPRYAAPPKMSPHLPKFTTPSNTTTNIDRFVDTVVFYHKDIANPDRNSSYCATDSFVLVVRVYPRHCAKGLTGGRALEEIMLLPPDKDTFISYPPHNIIYRLVSSEDATDLRPGFRFRGSQIDFNTTDNHYPRPLIDVIDVIKDPPDNAPGTCTSTGRPLSDTVKTTIIVSSSPRLRPTTAPDLIDIEVYEGDEVRVTAGGHINANVPYEWTTVPSAASPTTGLPSNSGRRDLGGDFVYTAVTGISTAQVDTLLFLRKFPSNNPDFYGQFDSLKVRVHVRPRQRLTSSTSSGIDTIVHVLDYTAQRVVLGRPLLNTNVFFEWTQMADPRYVSAPGVTVVNPVMPTQDSFVYAVTDNYDNTEKGVYYRLVNTSNPNPSTQNTFKDTVYVSIRQSVKDDYLRDATFSAVEKIYIAGDDLSPILIRSQINQGINFLYKIIGDGFMHESGAGSRNGVGVGQLSVTPQVHNSLVTDKIDTLQIISLSGGRGNAALDTFKFIVVQRPIVRLRSLGYPFSHIRQSVVGAVNITEDEIIYDNIPFAYIRQTNHGATNTGTLGTPVLGQRDGLTITVERNLTDDYIFDTILLFREGLYLNNQDSIQLIVAVPPSSNRLLKSTFVGNELRKTFAYGEEVIIDDRYIDYKVSYDYTVKKHGALDPTTRLGASTADVFSASGMVIFYTDTNRTTLPINDTIIMSRSPVAGNPNTARDTLKYYVTLNPIRRLRPVHVPLIAQRELRPYSPTVIRFSSEFVPTIPFKKRGEFPPRTYNNAIDYTIGVNATNSDIVITDTLYRDGTLLNNLDTVIIRIVTKPVRRLRVDNTPPRISLQLKTGDSITLGKSYFNQGVPFKCTYKYSSLLPSTEMTFVTTNQDSVKIYGRANFSTQRLVDTLEVVRNIGTVGYNEQDTLIIYVNVPQGQGITQSNIRVRRVFLQSNDTLREDGFANDQRYIYETLKYDGTDRDRVIDSNYNNNDIIPPVLFGQGNFIATGDSSLGVALVDTLRFLSSNARGVYEPISIVPSWLDTFDIIVTLLPTNLTNGEYNASVTYPSGKQVTYSQFLNEDVEFDWTFLGAGAPQTGISATGTGVNSITFTTADNLTETDYVDEIRLVKKFGSIKTDKDTLIVRIHVTPIPRIAPIGVDTVRYSFHSDRAVVIDDFNRNVPFYWDESDTRIGIDKQGSTSDRVTFTTTSNLTSSNIADTIHFVKKPDGHTIGSWDTLVAIVSVKPLIKLYDETKYPNQRVDMYLCAGEELLFTDLIKGVNFSYQSGITGASYAKQTGVDELSYTVGANKSRKDYVNDTLTLLRDPLVDSDDRIRPWDSLVLYLHIRPQPPKVQVTLQNTDLICPGSYITKANLSVQKQPITNYGFIWTRDGSIVGRDDTLPSQRIGVYEDVVIRVISTSVLCENSINDTTAVTYSSYDFPEIIIDWTYPGIPSKSIYDTLAVCGDPADVVINNRVIKAKTLPNDIGYSWQSSSLSTTSLALLNTREMFTSPSRVGIEGQNGPYADYDVALNVKSRCFDSTINTVLRVLRSPELKLSITDTLCLPFIDRPKNISIDYDNLDYRWAFSPVRGFVDPFRIIQFSGTFPIVDFNAYMRPTEEEKNFYIRLRTTSICGRNKEIVSSMHVFNNLVADIKLDPLASSRNGDSLCISRSPGVYTTGMLSGPAKILALNPRVAWEVNDNIVATTKDFTVGLNDVIKFLNDPTDAADVIRFSARSDKYNCYADVEKTVRIIQGISHDEEMGLTYLQHNYCPPARASFQSNFYNATNWEWLIDGNTVLVDKRSSNTKLATRRCTSCPSSLPADTSHLNNEIFSDEGRYKVQTVAGNDAYFCPLDTATTIIQAFAHPTLLPPDIESQTNVICLPEDVTFINRLNTYSSDIKEYYWALDDENFIPSGHPKYKRFVVNTGTSSIIMNNYVIDGRGCRSLIAATSIVPTPKPIARFIYKDICLGDVFYTHSVAFQYSTNDKNKYIEWDMGDGTIYINQNSVEHSYQAEGEYPIQLIVGYRNKNCTPDTSTATITVYAPISVEIEFPSMACLNTNIPFKVSSDNSLDVIQNYAWAFGDPALSSSEAAPIRSFSKSGIYEVELVAVSKFCNITSSARKQITITEPLRLNKRYPTIRALKDNPLQLSAELGGLSYLWNHELFLNDPTISNPFATVNEDTRFEVRINFNGCVVTDVQDVLVVDKSLVAAPTSFTPNGDGVNDEFIPVYSGTGAFNYLRIFDASGFQVYGSPVQQLGWDGTYNGRKLPVATYKWVVSIVNEKGVEVFYSGVVLLGE